MLFGCEINTPPLPPLDKPSFSYEEIMKQQKQLEQEIEESLQRTESIRKK